MTNLFRGGVPTGPDVDRLIAAFPLDDMGPGSIISYVDVSSIIGEAPGSGRFKSVSNAWRRRMFRERLWQTIAEGGAFRILTADECVRHGITSVTRLGRASGRVVARTMAIRTEEVSPALLPHRRVLQLQAIALRDAARLAAAAIAAPTAINTRQD